MTNPIPQSILCRKVTKLQTRKTIPTSASSASSASSDSSDSSDSSASSASIVFKYYSPKVRQQVMSNKLLNGQLYELYVVRKLHCGGKWLRDTIVDGTITIAKQIYIVSWLDILPTDAYKEEAVVLSLRSPKYKDSRSKEYSHSYAVVSKIPE